MPGAPKPRLLFITYHYVRPAQYPFSGIHPISLQDFSDQVQALRQSYHFASPAEVEAFVAGDNRLPSDSVFLTFDDGLTDHWIACRQVLDPFGIKAAFFACSRPPIEARALSVHKVHWLRAHTEPPEFAEEFFSYLPEDQRPDGSEDWVAAAERTYVYDTPQAARLKFALNFVLPADVVDDVTSRMFAARGIDEADFCSTTYMSDEQLRQLTVDGHVVGVHGHSHRPFSELDEELHDDVARNVDYIGQATGRRPDWVCYPYGRKTAIPDEEALADLFSSFDFRLGVTLLGDWNVGGEDRKQLRRINTNEVPVVAV